MKGVMPDDAVFPRAGRRVQQLPTGPHVGGAREGVAPPFKAEPTLEGETR